MLARVQKSLELSIDGSTIVLVVSNGRALNDEVAVCSQQGEKHIQSGIDSNLQAAEKAVGDEKLRVVASRKKKLREGIGIQGFANRTRFKPIRERGGYYKSNRADIELPKFDPQSRAITPKKPPNLRLLRSLVSVEKFAALVALGPRRSQWSRTSTALGILTLVSTVMDLRAGLGG
ncbi:hypothetical protein DOTSEDRAFT_36585 [Dothistroma septosporum NZE10]|uniref:Uncharacterized protein n=1 Tax=Dothistroma septosporum (strain NZE10 / CBS 128990) TaxID=675120 RepID=N1PIJ3_DOTSN|nr:hypothetical protein DOTSEDRAFT_36585 [Dothistroma septosporum NZE10]